MMGMVEHLPYLVAAWVLAVGLFGIVTSRDLVHLAVCLSVLLTSVHVLLLAVGFRQDGTAPIADDDVPDGSAAVDPVVQALAVTDIVVGATVTALLLALTLQVHKRTSSLDPASMIEWRG